MILDDRNDDKKDIYLTFFKSGWYFVLPIFIVGVVVTIVLALALGEYNTVGEWIEIGFGTLTIAVVAITAIGGIMLGWTALLGVFSDNFDWMVANEDDSEPLWLEITGYVLFFISLIYLSFSLDTYGEYAAGLAEAKLKHLPSLTGWLKGFTPQVADKVWHLGSYIACGVGLGGLVIPWATAHTISIVNHFKR